MPTVANLHFEALGERAITYIPNVASNAAVQAFALAIQAYTQAAVTRAGYTEISDLIGTETNGDFQDVDLYLTVNMRRQDTLKLVSLILPAPKAEYLELVENRGWRLKQADGEAITGLYEALTGLDLQYESGWMCGNSG